MSRVTTMVALSAALVAACDDRVAVRKPTPTWARMLEQRRADPWEATSAFPDGKVMQRPPAGTIAIEDDRDAPPPPVTRPLLELGRARFDAFCAVCHGITGSGDSVVATKMSLRAPPSLVDADRRRFSRERLYQVVTDGYGLMNSYADVLSAEERWAVVAYVQALQLSRHATVARLPASVRERLANAPEPTTKEAR